MGDQYTCWHCGEQPSGPMFQNYLCKDCHELLMQRPKWYWKALSFLGLGLIAWGVIQAF